MPSDVDSQLKNTALRLLGRREHSTQELHNKLTSRGFASNAVEAVLQWCSEAGWLSDERYTESYIRYRSQRGFGPQRIRAELRSRGVSSDIVENYMATEEEQWPARLATVYQKRYGDSVADSPKERARRIRFLLQRGFSQAQVMRYTPTGSNFDS